MTNVRRIALGDMAEDTITGFKGVVVASTDWLYGCRRLTLQPREMKDGKPLECSTFDEPQLKLVELENVVSTEEQRSTGGPRPEPQRHGDPA